MNKLHFWLKKNSISGVRFSEETGINYKTVSKLVNQKNTNYPTIETLLKIKEAYPKIDLTEVFPFLQDLLK